MSAAHYRPIAVCPYCKHEQSATPGYDIRIALCDPDAGGCDRYFAYRCMEQPRTYITQSSTLVLSNTIPQLTTNQE